MSTKSTLIILIFSFISLLFLETATAQQKGIFELRNSNSNSAVKSISSKLNLQQDRFNFYELSQKLHTTVYISNNAVNHVYGEGKIKKITFNDTQSFNLLGANPYNTVELITINVSQASDLKTVLNLNKINNLESLKYVFIICYFECSAEQIADFITPIPNIRVFHKIETPS